MYVYECLYEVKSNQCSLWSLGQKRREGTHIKAGEDLVRHEKNSVLSERLTPEGL